MSCTNESCHVMSHLRMTHAHHVIWRCDMCMHTTSHLLRRCDITWHDSFCACTPRHLKMSLKMWHNVTWLILTWHGVFISFKGEWVMSRYVTSSNDVVCMCMRRCLLQHTYFRHCRCSSMNIKKSRHATSSNDVVCIRRWVLQHSYFRHCRCSSMNIKKSRHVEMGHVTHERRQVSAHVSHRIECRFE